MSDQFDKLFQGVDDNYQIEYKLIQPTTGEILTKTGTKHEIKELKEKGYNVFVDKDLGKNLGNSNGISLNGNSIGNAINKLANQINKSAMQNLQAGDGRKLMSDGSEWQQVTEGQNNESDFKQQALEQTKNALVAVGKGSGDIIKSTAVNTYQALVHALFAGAGFCVIAGTTFVLQKTIKLLPGAASGVGKMINQLVASTGETVKQITSSVAEAAEKAAKEASKAEEAAETATETEEVIQDESKSES